MPKWELQVLADMTLKERWIVEADTLGEAIEKMLDDASDAEYIDQESMDDERNRRVIAGREFSE